MDSAMGLIDAPGGTSVHFECLPSPDVFRKDFFERKPFTGEGLRWDFSLECLENAIECGLVEPQRLSAVRQGEVVPVERYLARGGFSRVVDVRRLGELLDEGHTVIVNDVHLWNPEVSEAANELVQRFGCDVRVNAYYTPAGRQGFSVHGDDHDVVVAQISGLKAWSIWEPVEELPTVPTLESPESGARPYATLDLVPGDLIYVPRGWLHSAHSVNDASLHLTFGVRPYTWADELHRLIDQVSESDVAFRRSATESQTELLALLDIVRQSWQVSDLAQARSGRSLGEEDPRLRGYLSARRTRPASTGHAYARRRSLRVEIRDMGNDGWILDLVGRSILLPTNCGPAVQWILDAPGGFQVDEVESELSLESLETLISKLVLEGVLFIIPTEYS